MFPESLEGRLGAAAAAAGLPLQAVLLLPVDDPPWGQRLVALVRPTRSAGGAAAAETLLAALAGLVAGWPPAERPQRWLICGALAPSPTGKWERGRWRHWLEQGRSR